MIKPESSSDFKDVDNPYIIQEIEISDESDPEELEDIPSFEDNPIDDQDIEDLDRLMIATAKKEEPVRFSDPEKFEPKTLKRSEIVDDFIRNFMIKHKMQRSLEVFQQEWYELSQKGKITSDTLGQIPDIYIKNEKLEESIDYLKSELDKAKLIAEKAKATWDKLRKERDFHKMHHHRVQQEKKRLNQDIEKLKALHKQYEFKYQEISSKYEAAMKEKMLLKLERDRLSTKTDALQKSLQTAEEKLLKETAELPKLETSKEKEMNPKLNSPSKIIDRNKTKIKLTPFPSDERTNPYLNATLEGINYKNASLFRSYAAHSLAISCVAMHPKKSIIATGSDDFSWKIFTLPAGDLIMSGEGHKSWISGLSFHPKGSHLVTSSGDSTVKIWDFINASCMHTFTEHKQPVWSVAFHDGGDFIVSGSMDHTAKLIDLNALKTRNTFRGHVDSVNNVNFQPYSNVFCSSSADKTLSLWDMKSGLCVQTFYGHLNSVNHGVFNLRGDTLASCDADGVVKIWDVRMVKERGQYDIGPYSANSVAFDKSSQTIAVASDEGFVKLINEPKGIVETKLQGHEDAVQDVVFDYNSKMIVSCGSDATFKVFQ